MNKFKWSSHHKGFQTWPWPVVCATSALTPSALCREPVPGGGGPRGDPPPERLCVLRHGLQGAGDGVSWGLRAAVLPAHPQQAAEIRLPVHRRLLIRGRGGETLGVWLPRVFLRPSTPPPPTSQTPASWGCDSHVGPPRGEVDLERKQKRILSIL